MNWRDEIKNLEGWHFGGKGSGLEDPLSLLVKKGVKTATSSWFESYDHESKPVPNVGQRSYILDSQDRPVCVIEITKIEIKKFLEVDNDFARLEGEGDLSLRYWREGHNRFFESYGTFIGLKWDPEIHSVVCEHFKVIYMF